MEIGGLLRGLGGGLCDGLGDVVAGDGLAREGVGELGPRQQLRDGRQLQVVEVNIDLLQYSQYAEKVPAFKHGFSTRNWDSCPQRSSFTCYRQVSLFQAFKPMFVLKAEWLIRG